MNAEGQRRSLLRTIHEEDRGHATPCWIWQSTINSNGYGVSLGLLAHRRAYDVFVGPVPKDLQIDHLCRVRRCINPWHLEPVTAHENTLRGLPYRKRGHVDPVLVEGIRAAKLWLTHARLARIYGIPAARVAALRPDRAVQDHQEREAA